MQKVVINRSYGGFGLSDIAKAYYAVLKGINISDVPSNFSIKRNDTALVKTVLDLGKKANGRFASLQVIEIPDDVKYEIDDYDGMETIHEVHRSWP